MALGPPLSLFAQTPEDAAEKNTGAFAETVYVIRRIDYRIDGKTRPRALEREGEFREDLRFTGRAALDEYVEEKDRNLHNLRAFREGSSVAYTLGEPEADGTVPVYLEVSVTDSSSLIILPEPKYDSNAGFTLSLNLREYNFWGTLAPFKFDLLWKTDEKNRTAAGFILDAALPFYALGRHWKINAFNEFRYYLSGEPAYNKSALGIALELPWKETVFTLGFEQGLVVHEENDDRDDINDGDYHDWYAYSRPAAGWEIPTPLEAGSFGPLVYTPEAYGVFNYRPGDVGEYRRGPAAGFNQELGFRRVDWVGNFRRGLAARVFNGNEYNLHRRDWNNSAGAGVEGHLRFSALAGVSGRILYTRWFGEPYKRAGDTMRGYRDDELYARERLALNVDLPFRLIRFVPSEWKNNEKYHFLDFEQHWSLFADFLMLDAPNERTQSDAYAFRPEDLITALGLEIITFPLKWRSVYLRVSAGWNLREWIRTGRLPSGIHREVFIGLGHFY